MFHHYTTTDTNGVKKKHRFLTRKKRDEAFLNKIEEAFRDSPDAEVKMYVNDELVREYPPKDKEPD